MVRANPLEILKEAILLERRGRAFYQQMAVQAHNSAVKSFFSAMAVEEQQHMHILGDQFKAYTRTKSFNTLDPRLAEQKPLADLVFESGLKDQIAAADFEAAAITAAMLMEERAVALYSERAGAAEDPQERALYQWLAGWEQAHLSFLAGLDRQLKERVWHDNRFWPF